MGRKAEIAMGRKAEMANGGMVGSQDAGMAAPHCGVIIHWSPNVLPLHLDRGKNIVINPVQAGITQRLSSIVQARILTFFGHVSRRDNDSIERLVVQGRIEGTRSRGRSPIRWADQIKAEVAVPV
ncbi:jg8961 [Pararge aegeria aegeria]|uniref:Jg8961 protein n=1 Tax=Pararge aegeria aegeria TaxID=348720 RepID=A0A8S4SBS2_9NEOP|nr:jg8961 [Pararge aegeria aegeria]